MIRPTSAGSVDLRFLRSLSAGVFFPFLSALFLGCGGGEHADENGASGDVECRGSECDCPGSGDCAVDCDGDCDLACTGSGDCDFSCGAECLVDCPGSGECLATVGDNSEIVCTGSGGCDVVCEGDCTVDCPGSGPCIVHCDPEAETCEFTRCDDEVTCDDDVLICNGQCPS